MADMVLNVSKVPGGSPAAPRGLVFLQGLLLAVEVPNGNVASQVANKSPCKAEESSTHVPFHRWWSSSVSVSVSNSVSNSVSISISASSSVSVSISLPVSVSNSVSISVPVSVSI